MTLVKREETLCEMVSLIGDNILSKKKRRKKVMWIHFSGTLKCCCQQQTWMLNVQRSCNKMMWIWGGLLWLCREGREKARKEPLLSSEILSVVGSTPGTLCTPLASENKCFLDNSRKINFIIIIQKNKGSVFIQRGNGVFFLGLFNQIVNWFYHSICRRD